MNMVWISVDSDVNFFSNVCRFLDMMIVIFVCFTLEQFMTLNCVDLIVTLLIFSDCSFLISKNTADFKILFLLFVCVCVIITILQLYVCFYAFSFAICRCKFICIDQYYSYELSYISFTLAYKFSVLWILPYSSLFLYINFLLPYNMFLCSFWLDTKLPHGSWSSQAFTWDHFLRQMALG